MSGGDGKLFDRDAMIAVFQRVGELCEQRGVYIEIAVYGGSSIMIQPSIFDPTRMTEDVDYVQMSKDPNGDDVQAIFNEASQSLDLGERVFRDDVTMLISDTAEYDFFAHYPADSGHFRVMTCKPEYLFAMKARSMRSGLDNRDAIDFFNLAVEIGVDTPEQMRDLLDKYFPGELLSRDKELKAIDILDYKNSLEDPTTEKRESHIRFIAR